MTMTDQDQDLLDQLRANVTAAFDEGVAPLRRDVDQLKQQSRAPVARESPA